MQRSLVIFTYTIGRSSSQIRTASHFVLNFSKRGCSLPLLQLHRSCSVEGSCYNRDWSVIKSYKMDRNTVGAEFVLKRCPVVCVI